MLSQTPSKPPVSPLLLHVFMCNITLDILKRHAWFYSCATLAGMFGTYFLLSFDRQHYVNILCQWVARMVHYVKWLVGASSLISESLEFAVSATLHFICVVHFIVCWRKG